VRIILQFRLQVSTFLDLKSLNYRGSTQYDGETATTFMIPLAASGGNYYAGGAEHF
jgi:hypothetical protein